MKFNLPFRKKKTPVEVPMPKENSERIAQSKDCFVHSIKDGTNNPSDLIIKFLPPNLSLIYIDNLVDKQTLNNDIIANLQDKPNETPENIKDNLSIPEINVTSLLEEAIAAIVNGSIVIHVDGFAQLIVANIGTSYSPYKL